MRMKTILGEEQWSVAVEKDDRGLSLILGFEDETDGSQEIVEEIKKLLKSIWKIRRST